MSRRSVLTAAVWAAPAIVVATSIPARAASGDNPGTPLAFNGPPHFEDDGTLIIEPRYGYASSWPWDQPFENPITATYTITVEDLDTGQVFQTSGTVVLTYENASQVEFKVDPYDRSHSYTVTSTLSAPAMEHNGETYTPTDISQKTTLVPE